MIEKNRITNRRSDLRVFTGRAKAPAASMNCSDINREFRNSLKEKPKTAEEKKKPN